MFVDSSRKDWHENFRRMHYAVLVSQLLFHNRFTRTRSISKHPNIFKLHVMKSCGCGSKHLRNILMSSKRKRVFSFTYGLLRLTKDKQVPARSI